MILLAVLACALPAAVSADAGTGSAPVASGSGVEVPSGSVLGPEPAPTPTAGSTGHPRIESVYSNPVADGDAGEAVLLHFRTPTDAAGWTLRDEAGHVATLPNETLSGRVWWSPEPDAVEVDADVPVREPGGRLLLANGGDGIELRRPDGTVVDEVSYDRAPEGERYRRVDAGEWRWRQLGVSLLEPVETTPASATAFVLPDAPDAVVDELRDADRRILLAGYTLTSDRVVEALREAHGRGVEVRVLLEGSPVGGTSSRQADALDRLADAGVPVRVLAGERDPFRYHHAKYAVVDDRAIVLSENWKPAGTGGRASRGWGTVLRDPALAGELAALFEADRSGPGSVSWTAHRDSVEPVEAGSATGRFPQHFAPAAVEVERARVLVAPDNARSELADLVREANSSVYVHQVSIDGADDPLLRAAIAAARNGTEVEILLGSATYVESENRALAEEIDGIAAREDLPLSADLAEPRGRFARTHVKGVIVDERHVVVGSLNWNPTAYGENREVVVVLTGAAVAGYYAEVFRADARDATIWSVPIGLVVAVVAAWVLLGGVAVRRISWYS